MSESGDPSAAASAATATTAKWEMMMEWGPGEK